MAKDLISRFEDTARLHQFARGKVARPYSEFSGGDYDAVINFVGAGDPARAKNMGAEIFSVTRDYDRLVLDYLERNPRTRYIFVSSGAAHGGDFREPASDSSEVSIIGSRDYYSAAKQEAEARHRALQGRVIFDLRVFNYVSRAMDLSAHFLLAEMVNTARNRAVFRTNGRPLTRDFLHPADFAQLVECCLSAPDANMALDCYSQAPISKGELLELMALEFDMAYEITTSTPTANITGEKPQYYSLSRRAAALGYAPAHSSRSGITKEVGAILFQEN
jgi:nucleoside-diphosphate-sugar epimerase